MLIQLPKVWVSLGWGHRRLCRSWAFPPIRCCVQESPARSWVSRPIDSYDSRLFCPVRVSRDQGWLLPASRDPESRPTSSYWHPGSLLASRRPWCGLGSRRSEWLLVWPAKILRKLVKIVFLMEKLFKKKKKKNLTSLSQELGVAAVPLSFFAAGALSVWSHLPRFFGATFGSPLALSVPSFAFSANFLRNCKNNNKE